jgi:hypothetical protein
MTGSKILRPAAGTQQSARLTCETPMTAGMTIVTNLGSRMSCSRLGAGGRLRMLLCPRRSADLPDSTDCTLVLVMVIVVRRSGHGVEQHTGDMSMTCIRISLAVAVPAWWSDRNGSRGMIASMRGDRTTASVTESGRRVNHVIRSRNSFRTSFMFEAGIHGRFGAACPRRGKRSRADGGT